MTVKEFKKYVRFIPIEHEITNRLLGIGCECQKDLKRCVMEKGKWENYLESLKLVDGGEESSNIDIGDFMPAPWVAKDYLATGPDVRLFNPRAKGNRWDKKALHNVHKLRKGHSADFVGKQNVG